MLVYKNDQNLYFGVLPLKLMYKRLAKNSSKAVHAWQLYGKLTD